MDKRSGNSRVIAQLCPMPVTKSTIVTSDYTQNPVNE
jgi:hypothetical protein